MINKISPEKSSSLIPSALKCDFCANPIGVDNPNPLFSWELGSEKQSQIQTAWRLIVSSSEDLAAEGIGDLWDSGKVLSDEQFGIQYKGNRLSITTRYWWRVMVWDKDGCSSDWSNIATFFTGFFSMHDWNAEWFHTPYQVSYARKEFNIGSLDGIRDAVLFVAALGDITNSFQARLNGSKVGDDVLSPGPTEDFRALYMAYDVKDMLVEGWNALALAYIKKVSSYLVITYSDNRAEYLMTDDSWSYTDKGPYTYVGYDAPFRRGRCEEYNALLEFDGWDSPGYKNNAWIPVKLDGFRSEPLFIRAQMTGCKISEIHKPVSIVSMDDNKYIVDFGQNMSGFVRYKTEGASGTEILVKYAENLTPDGKLDLSTHSANEATKFYTKHILKGRGTEVYAPTFMYAGFRYVEISGYPGILTEDKIEACFIHSDIRDGSSFFCSDEELNRLQKCSVYSFLSNLVNIPTDCPGRERRGWTADAFAVSEASCINFNMLKLYEKWFDDMKDCQKSFGWMPVELPQSTVDFIEVIWPTACVLIPWDYYMIYGDKHFLNKYYGLMKNYVDFLNEISSRDHSFVKGHVVAGDWLAYDPATTSYMAMIYYYRSAYLLSRIAGVIGKNEDNLKYQELADDIKNSINNRYLKQDSEGCYYDNNSQSANAHALFFDLVPDTVKSEVIDSLIKRIRQDGTNTTGFLGTMCLIPVLSEFGYIDIAFELIKNKKEGGWLYAMDTYNLTTMAEDYYLPDFIRKTRLVASYNHAFLCGSLSTWFYKYLVGLSPLKPGYKEVRIKPYIPEGIQNANAKIQTMYGMLSAGWEKTEGGILKISVTIPPNTKALIHVPAASAENITESGRSINMSDHINVTGYEEGYTILEAGSGSYVLEIGG